MARQPSAPGTVYFYDIRGDFYHPGISGFNASDCYQVDKEEIEPFYPNVSKMRAYSFVWIF